VSVTTPCCTTDCSNWAADYKCLCKPHTVVQEFCVRQIPSAIVAQASCGIQAFAWKLRLSLLNTWGSQSPSTSEERRKYRWDSLRSQERTALNKLTGRVIQFIISYFCVKCEVLSAVDMFIMVFRADDWGSMFLRNVGLYLQVLTALRLDRPTCVLCY
jgi:hypothetical protein